MKKRKLSLPNSIIVLMCMAVIFAIMTWIIPAGVYDTEVIDGKTQYIAGTFHFIDQTGVGFWPLMRCIANGFTKNANIFFMIFFTGAAVYMLEQTNCLNAIFKKVAGTSSKSTPLILAIVMLFMSVVGSTGAFSNSTVALVPIGVLLAGALGLDKAMGFIIVFLGAYSGFNVGATNVFTVGVAQGIAELPIFSGMPVRIVFHAVNFLATYALAMLYVKKIRKDACYSLNYEEGRAVSDFMGVQGESSDVTISKTQWATFIGFIVAIVVIVYASIKLGWGMIDFTAVFLLLCIYIALVNKYTLDQFVKALIKGCATMVGAGLITAFCGGLSLILTQGNIIHTVVYYLSKPIETAGPSAGSVMMFLFNYVFNFFIPSGSGQAAAVMPLMVPLADVAGITRQVAVQAYQFGDGFSNVIVPTSGTLMACLALADIPFGKYAKWIAPFLVLQVVVASIALVALQNMGWMGF